MGEASEVSVVLVALDAVLVLGAAFIGGGGVKLLAVVVSAEAALVVAGACGPDSTTQIATPAIAKITQQIISFSNGGR